MLTVQDPLSGKEEVLPLLVVEINLSDVPCNALLAALNSQQQCNVIDSDGHGALRSHVSLLRVRAHIVTPLLRIAGHILLIVDHLGERPRDGAGLLRLPELALILGGIRRVELLRQDMSVIDAAVLIRVCRLHRQRDQIQAAGVLQIPRPGLRPDLPALG